MRRVWLRAALVLCLLAVVAVVEMAYLGTPEPFRASVSDDAESAPFIRPPSSEAPLKAPETCPEPSIPDLDIVIASWPKLGAFLARQFSCNSPNDNKYIVHIATAGLGNRIQSIISSLVLAVVTDRCLIVDWRVEELLPCAPQQLWCRPSRVPHVWDRSVLPEEGAEDSLFVSFHAPSPAVTEILTCAHPRAALSEHRFVFINTDEYYIPLLAYNDALRTDLPLVDATVYATLVRLLFQPRPALLQRFQRAHGTETCAVGIHLRVKGPRPLPLADVGPRTAECFAAALSAEPRFELTSADRVWLVSDRRDGLSDALKVLRRQSQATVSVLTHSYTRSTCGAIEEAVAEAWMVATCKRLILTEWSSFGYVISGLSGERAWSLRNGTCERLPSSLPCYNEFVHMKSIECFDRSTLESLASDPCCKSGFCSQCLHHARWKIAVEEASASVPWVAVVSGVVLFALLCAPVVAYLLERLRRREPPSKYM